MVGISQSPFKTINGNIKISTPGKIVIEKDDSPGIRGPFGTFNDEDDNEE